MDVHIPDVSVDSRTTALIPQGYENVHLDLATSAYINAGGRGTRLQPLFSPEGENGVSKALLPIGDPPLTLIEHQINKLSQAGMQAIVAGVGDHHHVARHVEATYSEYPGIHAVAYDMQMGTGGDLIRAVRDFPELFGDDIFVTNTDVLLDVSEPDFITFHQEVSAALSILLTEIAGVPNENAYYIDASDKVVHCEEVRANQLIEHIPDYHYRASSAGALIIAKELLFEFPWQPDDGPLSLYDQVVGAAISAGEMFAYNNGDRLFIDVGTVATWETVVNNGEIFAPYIQSEPKREELAL